MTKILKLAILLLAIVGFAAASATVRRDTNEDTTDRLLFNSSIENFTKARDDALKTRGNPSLDFTSDGCSKVASWPLGFDFLESCQRHDFGYRNYKHQNRFNDTNREKIDMKFRKDMGNECAKANDTSTGNRHPFASIIAGFGNIIAEFLQPIINNGGCIDGTGGDGTYTEGDGAGTDGNGSFCGDVDNTTYSDKDVCDTIADAYYEGVAVKGLFAGNTGASGRYGAGDNVYFLGVYVAFVSSLVFGW
jgi:hypothetical protein